MKTPKKHIQPALRVTRPEPTTAAFTAKSGSPSHRATTSACLPVLPLLLALALPLAAQAQFKYSVANGKATITGYTGSGGAVTIPGSLDGYPVTRIGDHAFQYGTSLTSVTFPASVTSIGGNAFNYCGGLKNLTVPGSVTDIGEWAFSDCGKLASLVISNGVTSLGYGAFGFCANLSEVSLPASLSTIAGGLFSGCSSLTNIVIPGSVTNILGYAFLDCTGLARVTIPQQRHHHRRWGFFWLRQPGQCGNSTQRGHPRGWSVCILRLSAAGLFPRRCAERGGRSLRSHRRHALLPAGRHRLVLFLCGTAGGVVSPAFPDRCAKRPGGFYHRGRG